MTVMIEQDNPFRAVNDRIRELESGWQSDAPLPFVCECAGGSCTAAVYLTIAEYEDVRAHASHLFTLPDHVVPELDRVVRSTDRYAVVERASRQSGSPSTA